MYIVCIQPPAIYKKARNDAHQQLCWICAISTITEDNRAGHWSGSLKNSHGIVELTNIPRVIYPIHLVGQTHWLYYHNFRFACLQVVWYVYRSYDIVSISCMFTGRVVRVQVRRN